MSRHKLRHHGTDLRLEPGELLIGRDPACGISLQDPAASRHHARLRVTEEGVWLEEVESKSGVHVNGRRIVAPTRLAIGDWFRIGNEEFGLLASARAEWDEQTGVVDPATRPTTPPVRAEVAEIDEVELPQVDPVVAIEQSGRKLLADEALPSLERFSGVLHLVKVLVDTRAPAEARDLLGAAIDLLARKDARGILPPLCAARARALLGRWSSALAEDDRWRTRLETLARAEHLDT